MISSMRTAIFFRPLVRRHFSSAALHTPRRGRGVLATSTSLLIAAASSTITEEKPECGWFGRGKKDTVTRDDEKAETILEKLKPPTPAADADTEGSSNVVEDMVKSTRATFGRWRQNVNTSLDKLNIPERQQKAKERYEALNVEAAHERALDILYNRDGERERLKYSLEKEFDRMIDEGLPAQLTLGFAAGFCSGYALKKASRIVVVGVGVLFCVAQTMSYYELIDLRYADLAKAAKALDANGDGRVDHQDAMAVKDDIMTVLTHNVPATSGYGAGVLLGFRKG